MLLNLGFNIVVESNANLRQQ